MAKLGGREVERINRRIRACDYLSVAQLFLQDNFLLERSLDSADIKPRLLGHWGTCHGINVAYANLFYHFSVPDTTGTKPVKDLKYAEVNPFAINSKAKPDDFDVEKRIVDPNYHFILGPGHGFPALQANLFLDGDLAKVDDRATQDFAGLEYICRNFSWPGGFPSHASPFTPGVICEGGELGYALGAAYGLALGRPEKTVAVLLGDGELETAAALASLNLVKTVGNHEANGLVIPILHLNGYKISAPSLYGRKSERELGELIRGFGYQPIVINGDAVEEFQTALAKAERYEYPFLILKTEKGATGPTELHGNKIAGNFLAHQIPLPNAKSDREELKALEVWLKSYNFTELFDKEKGFMI